MVLSFWQLGILGFVPGIAPAGSDGMPMVLGIFMVNTTHSIVHIASGAVFLFASMAGAGPARLWFKLFGLVYAVVAILGFMTPNGMLLGLISNNPGDTWLHVGLAVAMLLIGFASPKTATA